MDGASAKLARDAQPKITQKKPARLKPIIGRHNGDNAIEQPANSEGRVVRIVVVETPRAPSGTFLLALSKEGRTARLSKPSAEKNAIAIKRVQTCVETAEF